ncbi:hypothetical protein ABPG75_013296 [Micractinium tetrahymenae]
MGACSPCNILFHVFSICTSILAILIAILVSVKLMDVSVSVDGTNVSYNYSCLLGTDYGSSSLCTYTYVVIGVSLAVSLAVSLLQCLTCNLCGLGNILDILLAAFGTVWWAVASGVIASHANDPLPPSAQPASDSVSTARDAVPIMTYIEVGLFAAMFVSSIFRCCRT